MKQIRNSVFETNSSSTHSLTINSKILDAKINLEVNGFDNNIHVSSGEFGWGYEELTSQYKKLSYLVTMMFEKEIKNIKDAINIYESESFKLIDDAIFEHTGHHIALDEIDLKRNKINIEGYIDHQSYEKYASFKDFLEQNNVSVIEFVFGDTIMKIDNDNHY